MTTVCGASGCPAQIKRGERYCPEHKPRHSGPRSPSSRVTGTRRWRAVKARVLRRDGHRCHYCGKRATTVDHVRPVALGGAPFDERNLVASCVSCNAHKGGRHADRS